jgi:hypothetical protein
MRAPPLQAIPARISTRNGSANPELFALEFPAAARYPAPMSENPDIATLAAALADPARAPEPVGACARGETQDFARNALHLTAAAARAPTTTA